MLSSGFGAPNCSGLPQLVDDHLFHPGRDRVRREGPSGLRGEAGESDVIRRHAGEQLLQHIALAAHGDGDLRRARRRQFACDFERADRTAGNEHGLPAIGFRPSILGAMNGAAASGKAVQPCNFRHVRRRAAARRNHDAREEFRCDAVAASRADDPTRAGAAVQGFDPGRQTKVWREASRLGVAL